MLQAASVSAGESTPSDSRKCSAVLSPLCASVQASGRPLRPENGEVVLACAVRERERRGKPAHRDPCRDRKIVPFGKLGQGAVVLAEVQHRPVKALAVAVPGAVNAALKDVRRA